MTTAAAVLLVAATSFIFFLLSYARTIRSNPFSRVQRVSLELSSTALVLLFIILTTDCTGGIAADRP